jgi:hypothetical protein
MITNLEKSSNKTDRVFSILRGILQDADEQGLSFDEIVETLQGSTLELFSNYIERVGLDTTISIEELKKQLAMRCVKEIVEYSVARRKSEYMNAITVSPLVDQPYIDLNALPQALLSNMECITQNIDRKLTLSPDQIELIAHALGQIIGIMDNSTPVYRIINPPI